MSKKEFSVNKIDLAEYKNENPVRTCYSINAATKERLTKAIKGHAVLNASMFVDLAINLLLNDIENNHLEFTISLNNKD